MKEFGANGIPAGPAVQQTISMRLPAFSRRVNALFVAVPQIEHNWTAHRPAPLKPDFCRRDKYARPVE
jgi:hypothetical protein